MAWFRRKAGGRHALGAAVTSIPSGPPAAAAVLLPPVVALPEPAPEPAPAAVAPVVLAEVPAVAEPLDLMGSIAALLASGEAWAGSTVPEAAALPSAPEPVVALQPPPAQQSKPPALLHEPVAAAAPVDPPDVQSVLVEAVTPVPAAPSVPMAAPASIEQLPAPAHVHVPAPTPAPAPMETKAATPPAASEPPTARTSLEAALAELLPPQAASVEAPIAVEAPRPPRVQLGFRDGTSTTLEPGSSQSLALEQLAQSLTRRT